MGYAMASRLARDGYRLIVWNRSISKAERFSKEFSAEVSTDLADLARKADIIHIMVSDDVAAASVISELCQGCSEGDIIIQQSTITPGMSTYLASLVESAGGTYVEAPVLGSVSEASKGSLITYIGGPKEAIDYPTIKSLSREVIYVGPVPKASALKLSVNALFLSIAAALAESEALAMGWGIEPELFRKVMSSTWMAPIVERYWERGHSESFPTRFKLALAAKDLTYAAEAMRRAGIPSPTVLGAASTYSLCASEGFSVNDYSHVILCMSRKASKSSS
jgi:3-hydroxyisobutyrate dehydrogenase